MTYIALAIGMVVSLAIAIGYAAIAIGNLDIDDDYEPL